MTLRPHRAAWPDKRRRAAGTDRTAMNETYITEHQVQRADELVSWTFRERLRFLWYRLRLTVQEMNYAVRRMTDLQMRLP
jgi:hypothetical protein